MEEMNLTAGRGAIYLAGLAAGVLALSGYATFDSETWVLDIHPFNLREFMLTGATTAGNALAAIAVMRGWGRK